MSPTSRSLTFSVVVEDREHWPKAELAEADADPSGSYDDWVVDKLDDVMRAAGQAFIDQNPDLFRLNELI